MESDKTEKPSKGEKGQERNSKMDGRPTFLEGMAASLLSPDTRNEVWTIKKKAQGERAMV